MRWDLGGEEGAPKARERAHASPDAQRLPRALVTSGLCPLCVGEVYETRAPPGLGLSCPQPDANHPARWVRFSAPRPWVCGC